MPAQLLSIGGILFFLGAIKKIVWGGNFFFIKSVQETLIYIPRKFESDRIKIEATRKQKPPKNMFFFQALNRKNRPKKLLKKPCFFRVFLSGRFNIYLITLKLSANVY